MRAILAITVILLSGCANNSYKQNLGYRAEDPCIRCGQKWDQLPNQEFAAQVRRARGEQW